MIPVYSFLEGDSLGLLIFAYEDETIKDLIDKVQRAAVLRVKPRDDLNLFVRGRMLPLRSERAHV